MDIRDAIAAMKIYLLVLDGVFDTGLAALQDTLSLAHDIARHGSAPTYAGGLPERVGFSSDIRTANGLIVPTRSVTTIEPPDIVIVPALGAKTPIAIEDALSRGDVRQCGEVLRRWHAAGTAVAAACTGTFVLAESGLLDGRFATTSWWLTDLFRARYPRVRLDPSRTVIDAGGVVTAGAALAHFDLALTLIRRESRTLASTAARYLSIEDLRSEHAAFVIPHHAGAHDPVVERFEAWAQQHLSAGFSLSEAAKAVGASARTLTRKMQRSLGKTPLAVFQDLRVARAVFLLQTTEATVEEVSAEVGYADSGSLRLLLRRKLGNRVEDLRRKRRLLRREPA